MEWTNYLLVKKIFAVREEAKVSDFNVEKKEIKRLLLGDNVMQPHLKTQNIHTAHNSRDLVAGWLLEKMKKKYRCIGTTKCIGDRDILCWL